MFSSEANDVDLLGEIPIRLEPEEIVRYHQRKREDETDKLQGGRVEGWLRELLSEVIYSPQRRLQVSIRS